MRFYTAGIVAVLWGSVAVAASLLAIALFGLRRLVRERTAALRKKVGELEQVRSDLNRDHELLERVVKYCPVGIVKLDSQGAVLLCNPEADCLFGGESDARPENRNRLLPLFHRLRREDGKADSNPLISVCESGGTLDHVRFKLEREGKQPLRFLVSGTVLREETGSPGGLLFVVQEMTSRVEIEDRLRESEQRFNRLFMEMPDAYALHEVLRDINGTVIDYRFLMVNPAFERITGLAPEDLVGRRVKEVLPETEEHWIETYAQVVDSGEPVLFENHHRLLDRYYQVHAYSPGPEQFAVIFSDITERKHAEQERHKLEAQMLQAQKLESLGVLAGGIAHDFNNLLMAVLGNADLALASQPAPSGEIRDRLQDIEEAARRAADLCRQLLAYSGRGRFVVSNVDLQKMVEDMTRILSVSISKKAVLKFNFADNVPPVEGDATQFQQILMNLIVNASEAIGEKSGVISVSIGAMQCDTSYLTETFLNESLEPGLYTYIEVADTGSGMDAETRRRIFDPFYTTKFTGRGLGLAAILGIVRSHRGAIKVYSELGRGTTFKILLPASGSNESLVPEKGDSLFELPREHRSKYVLLVDDEDTVRDVGRKMLELAGFRVLTARDGREALSVFEADRERILCVVLDLAMPHMDGEEAFREIRRVCTDVPVILSSGYSEQEVLDRFAGKGLAAFLKKPYRSSELLATLGTILG